MNIVRGLVVHRLVLFRVNLLKVRSYSALVTGTVSNTLYNLRYSIKLAGQVAARCCNVAALHFRGIGLQC